MSDILVVIATFDFHVKPAITLATADLVYNFAESALTLWSFLVQQTWGPTSHTLASPTLCGPVIAFHVDLGRGVQRWAIARQMFSM